MTKIAKMLPTIRKLSSFSEYAAAAEKMRKVTDEFDAASTRLEAARNAKKRQAARVQAIRSSVEHRFFGKEPPTDDFPPDSEKLEFDVAVLRQAVFDHKSALDEI